MSRCNDWLQKKTITFNGIRGNQRPSHSSTRLSLITSFPLVSLSIHPLFILKLTLCSCCLFASLNCFVIGLSSSHRDKKLRIGMFVFVNLFIYFHARVCPPVSTAMCLCYLFAIYSYVIVSRRVQFVLSWRCVSVSCQPCDITLQQTIRTLCPTDALSIEGRGLGCHGD